jgi:hypothetical protein
MLKEAGVQLDYFSEELLNYPGQWGKRILPFGI